MINTMKRPSSVWCLGLVALLLLSCSGRTPVPQPEERPARSLLQGDRTKSKSVQAAENRPKPWDDEEPVFQEDRLLLEEAVERRRREHRDEHSARMSALQSFAHPACEGLPEHLLRSCPIDRVPWTASDEVPEGMVLRVPDPGIDLGQLRRWVLCHIAFGKAIGESSCPLHVSGVQVKVTRSKEMTSMTIVTSRSDQVETLRDRVKRLVR